MIDMKGRGWGARLTDPVGRAAARAHIPAWFVTLTGLVVTIVGAVTIGAGHPLTGAILVAAGSAIDAFDGAVARAQGTAGRRGAFLDTTFDRVGEIAMWTGVIFFLAGEQWVTAAAAAALGLSLMIPFLRARAEAEGVEGKGGLMGRAERVIVFCIGVGLQGFDLPTLRPTVWIMAALTLLTVVQRFINTWSRLEQ